MNDRLFTSARSLRVDPPPTLSDERLAELSADGLDSAFAMLVLRHRPALVCHCADLVGHTDAEEAVQEALLRAYLALSRGESVSRVGPWLRTIAHNAALNLLRARSARPTVNDQEPLASVLDVDVFERREKLRAVVAALAELPERQRQALVMRELEGRSYREIESRLQTSNGAVRQLLNRARAAVRDRLDAVAALVPGLRWIAEDAGGAATAARLGALSGGCAVTIKVCTATLLPAVVAPGAATHKRTTPNHAQAIGVSQPRAQTGTSDRRLTAGASVLLTSRGATATVGHRQRIAAHSQPVSVQSSAQGAHASRPRWPVRSASGTSTGSPGVPAPGGRNGDGGRSAPSGNVPRNPRAGSSPASTAQPSAPGANTPLEMAPEAPSSSTPAGANNGSRPQSSPSDGTQTSPRNASGPEGGSGSGLPTYEAHYSQTAAAH